MPEVVVLDGGLGNNLFQLHYAWTLKRNGTSKSVVLHLPKTRRYDETQFLESAAHELGLTFSHGSETPGSTAILIARLKRMLSEKRNFLGQSKVFTVTALPNYRLHCGYWQSIPFIPEARNAFDDAVSGLLPDGAIDRPILHIRGGDYRSRKNAKIYSALDLDYYRGACSEIESRMGPTEYKIVSNDPPHVNDLFSNENNSFALHRGKNALDDFCEISRHKVIVASNSTFCWWAARLGLYKGQTDLVIAPRYWMNEGYRHRSHPRYSSSTDHVVLKP